MLSKISSEQIYLGDYGWHTGRFHFSFADYDDPDNTNFGDLIAFNDFALTPNSGFSTHPHSEIEIISYCIEGELIHEDSMGNINILEAGDMQYTCAGSGIMHSESNQSHELPLRFVQIWLRPESKNLLPCYSSRHIERNERLNKCLHLASGQPIQDVTRIRQDANIYVTEIETGEVERINFDQDRQIYLACLDGDLIANNLFLENGDSLKAWDEGELALEAVRTCHLLVVEVSRS